MATAAKKTSAKPGRQPQDRKPAQAPSNGDDGFRITFEFDGRGYDITAGDLTAVESRLYRQQMGESLSRTMLNGDVDIDVIATLMWLMDRRDDPTLAWEAVAGKVDYANIGEIDLAADESPSD